MYIFIKTILVNIIIVFDIPTIYTYLYIYGIKLALKYIS